MAAKRFVKPENNRCDGRLVVKVNGIFEGVVFSTNAAAEYDVNYKPSAKETHDDHQLPH